MNNSQCPLCAKRGIISKISSYYINFEEKVLLCNNKSCPYPFGVDKIIIINKNKNIKETINLNHDRFSHDKKSEDNINITSHEEKLNINPINENGMNTVKLTSKICLPSKVNKSIKIQENNEKIEAKKSVFQFPKFSFDHQSNNKKCENVENNIDSNTNKACSISTPLKDNENSDESLNISNLSIPDDLIWNIDLNVNYENTDVAINDDFINSLL